MNYNFKQLSTDAQVNAVKNFQDAILDSSNLKSNILGEIRSKVARYGLPVEKIAWDLKDDGSEIGVSIAGVVDLQKAKIKIPEILKNKINAGKVEAYLITYGTEDSVNFNNTLCEVIMSASSEEEIEASKQLRSEILRLAEVAAVDAYTRIFSFIEEEIDVKNVVIKCEKAGPVFARDGNIAVNHEYVARLNI